MKKNRRILNMMMCFIMVASFFAIVVSMSVTAEDTCGSFETEQTDELIESDFQIVEDGTFFDYY